MSATVHGPASPGPSLSYLDPGMSAARRGVVRVIEALTGQRRLKAIYQQYRDAGTQADAVWDELMARSRLVLDYDPAALAGIPAEGPLVVVANHPYGVLDGLALCWLMRQRRADFRLLINSVLVQAPETLPYLLPIDFAPGPAALATNLRTRAEARAHLAAGGAIMVFPAGGVSTSPDRLGRLPARDAPWRPFVAQLQQQAKCPVVPIHFDGQNGRLFQMASHVSQTVRLALLAGEVARRFGTRLKVTIGAPLPHATLAPFHDRAALTQELCRQTYALGGVTIRDEGDLVPFPRALMGGAAT